MSQTDKYVLVTGATRGIGRSVATHLAQEGYAVVISYRDQNSARGLLAEIEQAGGRAAAYPCDLSVAEQVDDLARTCLDRHGAPYGLVTCAGRTADGLTSQLDRDSLLDTFQVNLFSSLQLVAKLIRPMSQTGAGRIVLMSSVSSLLGNLGNSVYGASKGALQAYVRSVVEECARRGVTINTVLPGYIETDMTRDREGWAETMNKRVPAKRPGRPQEVAAVVSFLLSEGASYVNATELRVDGGLAATLGV